jgi:glycosyltransferase involved in cell wall biosynthesis
MRIAILADYPLHTVAPLGVSPPVGHYATWLPQLSAAFARSSAAELHWLVVSRNAELPSQIQWQNQTFHFIHEPGRMRALFGFRRESRRIRKVLNTIAPQLVHAWGTESCYGLAAARSNRRFLLSMQGLLSHYVKTVPMHWLVRVQAWHERQVFRRTKHATVESRWGEHILRRWLPSADIRRVEYGVQERFFEQVWEPDERRPAAIFVGTIDERKGVQDAVEAFRDPRLQDRRLVVVGEPATDWGRALRATAPQNVEWLGRLPPEETAKELARAWCLVLPTRADTSPNVVKEARVIGLPVITTPEGGQSDYIEYGKNGFLIRPGDIRALRDALEHSLQHVQIARDLGKWQHEEQREFFRPEKTAALFAELYNDLVKPS